MSEKEESLDMKHLFARNSIRPGTLRENEPKSEEDDDNVRNESSVLNGMVK